MLFLYVSCGDCLLLFIGHNRRATDDDIVESHERALEWERYKRGLVEGVLLGHDAKRRSRGLLVDRKKAAGKLCDKHGVWRQQRQEFVVRI